MSLTTEKKSYGWLVQGDCSVGHVHAIGITEGAAIHSAKAQIRELQRLRGIEKIAEFRARFPGFVLGASV